mmetsp:Transcript_54376/g.126843  ORF Transcript_54376/g.126843 Transcript_54376/m.126843 type:complete len:209 (+) Transcript_54376:117-743(+)
MLAGEGLSTAFTLLWCFPEFLQRPLAGSSTPHGSAAMPREWIHQAGGRVPSPEGHTAALPRRHSHAWRPCSQAGRSRQLLGAGKQRRGCCLDVLRLERAQGLTSMPHSRRKQFAPHLRSSFRGVRQREQRMAALTWRYSVEVDYECQPAHVAAVVRVDMQPQGDPRLLSIRTIRGREVHSPRHLTCVGRRSAEGGHPPLDSSEDGPGP